MRRWTCSGTGLLCPTLVIALLLQPACSPAERTTVAGQVRDSAGVTIVEIPDRLHPQQERWFVSPEPSIVLSEAGPGREFYNVTGALVLQDGRIAVANGGSAEIFLFDETGGFQGSHGRRGEGPGEYKRPVIAGSLGSDTLVIVDSERRRISLVHAEDGFLSSSQIQEELGSPASPRGMFADRTMVVGGGHSWVSGSGDQETSGYSRPNTSYRSSTLDGTFVTDFGEFPGAELQITVIGLPDGESSMTADLIPFSKLSSVAVGPDFFFVGHQSTWEVQAFDSSGELKKILRLDRPPARVRDSDVEALIQESIEGASDPSMAPAIRREFAETTIPETMPAFSSLKVDPRGFLWVGRYRPPGETVPAYDVIDPAGSLVAEVSLPVGNRILQIGADFILTRHRDDLDVESVRLFSLERPGRSMP